MCLTVDQISIWPALKHMLILDLFDSWICRSNIMPTLDFELYNKNVMLEASNVTLISPV